MIVDCSYALVGSGHEELRLNELLDGEYDAVLDSQSDRCPTVLDRFVRIFDLKEATIRRVSAVDGVSPAPW